MPCRFYFELIYYAEVLIAYENHIACVCVRVGTVGIKLITADDKNETQNKIKRLITKTFEIPTVK